ncbi:MAG: hypothetical protein J6U92_03015 [Clostridia bacterium]|nr:hypothetical protein [Clostridia bacterium]
MGKPKKVQAAQVGTDYNWGEFGSANAGGVNLSPMATSNIRTTQSGIGQYLNELINPSYDNESFRARQELIDASNRQYANQLGAQAMARGARGSATQNILNSIAANRNMDMRQAMTQEDARVQNILSALSGIEGNYFNQANTMGNNILQRVLANQQTQQQANIANTNAYNSWKNNLISGAAALGGSALGAVLGGPVGASIGGSLFGGENVTDVNGNVLGKVGGYGTYQE